MRSFSIQRKNSKWNYDDEVWFDARPIGGNKLYGILTKSISEEAKLSKMYANHNVRVTAITLWLNAGVQNRHIMAISGHCSEQSLLVQHAALDNTAPHLQRSPFEKLDIRQIRISCCHRHKHPERSARKTASLCPLQPRKPQAASDLSSTTAPFKMSTSLLDQISKCQQVWVTTLC